MKNTEHPTSSPKRQGIIWPLIGATLTVVLVLVFMSPASGAQEGPADAEKLKPAAEEAAKAAPPDPNALLTIGKNGEYIFHQSKEKVVRELLRRMQELEAENSFLEAQMDSLHNRLFKLRTFCKAKK